MIGSITKWKQEVDKAMNDAQSYGGGDSPVLLDWDSLSIIDGEPTLDDEKARKACTKFIESEQQARVYEAMVQIKEKADEFLNLFKASNIKFPGWAWFVQFEFNGEVSILKDGPCS